MLVFNYVLCCQFLALPSATEPHTKHSIDNGIIYDINNVSIPIRFSSTSTFHLIILRTDPDEIFIRSDHLM